MSTSPVSESLQVVHFLQVVHHGETSGDGCQIHGPLDVGHIGHGLVDCLVVGSHAAMLSTEDPGALGQTCPGPAEKGSFQIFDLQSTPLASAKAVPTGRPVARPRCRSFWHAP